MTKDDDIVISVKNLSQRYGKGRLIYENLSFDVQKGRILGLLGKNGTGKTTILKIINGVIPADAKWNRAAYYELMRKLQVSPGQKIANMSCGQRSQVALGLILAQNADLLVLDDFSLGLDPGYRRLFVDYLREYAKAENKTVFMTSHIIQDMERLVDDCIILDYGRILVHKPVKYLTDHFARYVFTASSCAGLENDARLHSTSQIRQQCETYSFESETSIRRILQEHGISFSELHREAISLEDVFIGLTGKY